MITVIFQQFSILTQIGYITGKRFVKSYKKGDFCKDYYCSQLISIFKIKIGKYFPFQKKGDVC